MYDAPQDVYAKCLPSDRGYPLWFPEPSNTLPSSYRQDGLQIGDVGYVNHKGVFNVLFNISYGPNHALHRRPGFSFNLDPVPLDIDHEVDVKPNADPPGSIITSPGVTQPTQALQRAGHYEFTPSSAKGAILILPDGATSHDLLSNQRFRELAIERAFDWYAIAKERYGDDISNDSLYLITGFYKARSWSLASFHDATGAEDRHIWVVPRDNECSTAGRHWKHTFPLRYRDGPAPGQYGNANQTIFISGFKIAVRDDVLGWLSQKPDVQPVPAARPRKDLCSLARFLRKFGKKSNSITRRRGKGGVNVDHVPALSQPFHPSDFINRYLLNKDPSALVAVTHDSEWIVLIETGRITPEELTQGNRLEEFLSENYSVVSQPENNAVYLRSGSKDVDSSVLTDACGRTEGGMQPEMVSKSVELWHTGPSIDKFQMDITRVRAADVVAGFSRMPIGFYVLVQCNGTKRKTKNKAVRFHDSIVEWDERIHLPAEHSTRVQFSVCASFEFFPMLGNGEVLRSVEMCVGDLVRNTHLIMFPSAEGVSTSPCSSLHITTERRPFHRSGGSSDHVMDFDWEEASDLARLTDEGNNLLLRYRTNARNETLAASVDCFERALACCPTDNHCYPAVLCNLARAYFINYQIDRGSMMLPTSISYYREALELRSDGHPDRPATLLYLAQALLYHYGTLGFEEFPGEVVRLTSEIQVTCSDDSHERRAADLVLQTYALYKAISSGCSIDVDNLIPVLREGVQDVAPDYFDRLQRLSNVVLALWIRWELLGDLGDLDESIAFHQEIMQFTQRDLDLPTHAQLLMEREKATTTSNSWKDALVTATGFVVSRSTMYRILCERLLSAGRVTEAVECFRKMSHELGQEMPGGGEKWIPAFKSRCCERLEELGDIEMNAEQHEDAISWYTVALSLDPAAPKGLFIRRSKAYIARGLLEEALSDANKVIMLDPSSPWGYERKCVALYDAGDYDAAADAYKILLSKLAESPDPDILRLSTRYNQLEAMQNLDEAIALDREALDLRPQGHPHRSQSLNNLAVSLSTRYNQLGVMQNLEEAISLDREALGLRPPGHPDRSQSLNNLAVRLSTRYNQHGVMQDLEEAIALDREALGLRPQGHPDRSQSLNNLAVCLSTRYNQFGVMQDLDEAIVLDREALSLRPQGHPDRSQSLNNVAVRLSTRYNQLGVMQDLEEAIALDREALDLQPPGHPYRSLSLNNLAISFSTRYNQLGVMRDLEEAIALDRETLGLRPPGHPHRPYSLNNLAVGLSTRYSQLGVTRDLDEAIVLDREALDLRPPGHPHRSQSLNKLAVRLFTRYNQLGVMQDLEEAIALDREALGLLPQGHPDRSQSLNNLAVRLSTRYNQHGVMQDLEEAIALDREALGLQPPGHPYRPHSLSSLAARLSTRYNQFGVIQDLDEAIALGREALDLQPQGHLHWSTSLANLASHLRDRFMCSKQLADQEELFSLYAQLAQLDQVVSSSDVSAARAWISAAEDFQHPTILFSYETSLRLLCLYLTALPSLPQHLPIRNNLLPSVAMDAFSACLRNDSPAKAVELLEQGRGVFWNQLSRLRSPLDDVTASGMPGKSLADQFRHLASKIRTVVNSPGPDQHEQLCRLNLELQSVVTNIRELPGFSRFILPPLFSDLQYVASEGPVIIVNASQYGCDALVIMLGCDPFHILLHITQEGVQDLSRQLRGLTARTMRADVTTELTAFLRKIWDQIVSPIVDFLGTIYPTQSRIWWCPTAEFSFLPLHAAGPYRKGQQNLPDLYVSSYTPTLTALIRARRCGLEAQERRFLAIGQANAAGPSVAAELANIGQLVRDLVPFTHIDGEASCISRVVAELARNEWVHFACHGLPNRTQPFESAFALHDGHFTIERIMSCDLKNPEFAYLSASHTTVGDEESPDEVIHLAAAMQFIGFRSVIGTMCAVDDWETTQITSTFYKHMVDTSGRLDYTRAAYALNKTMRTVDVPLHQRILYIHLGA